MRTAAIVLIILMSLSASSYAEVTQGVDRLVVAGVDFDYPGELPKSLPGLVGISPGDEYSPKAVRRSIRLIYLMGMFTDIIVEGTKTPDGLVLTYHLVPKKRVEEIDVDGTDELSDKKVLGSMAIKVGDYLDGKLLDKSKENISKLMLDEGLREGNAEIEVGFIDDLTARLVVHVNEGRTTIVKDISFEGETRLSKEALTDELEFEPGDVLKKAELEKSVENLTALYVRENYVNVEADAEGTWFEAAAAHVVINIDAGPRLEVAFDGNSELSDSKLKDVLTFWEDKDVSPENVAANLERIAEFYHDKGYYHAAVTARTEQGGPPPRVFVRFIIMEGPRSELERITFTGNRSVEDDEILDAIELSESSVFSSSYVTDKKVEEDGERIKALYESRGFLGAEVRPGDLEFSDDGTKTVVNFDITEGTRTYLEAVRFTGNNAIAREKLEPVVSGGVGLPFNPKLVDEYRRDILNMYSQMGYIHATVDADKEFSEDGAKVDLVFDIKEGIPVSIGNIILRGNLDTKDTVIMRELLFKPAGVYDYEKILRSQQKIFKLGFMSQVKIQPVDPDKIEPVKDILISVKERPAGTVEFGVGYGDFDKFRGFAEVSYGNLFGYGHKVSARGELSTKETKAILGYRWPWFGGWPMDFRSNLVYLKAEKPNYDIKDFIASAGFDKTFGEHVTASITYQFERIQLDAPPDAVLAPEDKDKSNIASITPSAVIDYRDNPFNPSTGSVHGATLKWASNYLGSTVDFAKLTAQTSWYFPVYKGVVFAASARGGLARSGSDLVEVPISERFFLGGASSLRGFEFETVSPTAADGTPIGGDRMVLFNIELRIPLPYGFGLVGFLDAGNSWLENKGNIASSGSGVDTHVRTVGGLRYGAGAGIRYETPVGPLRLDWGFKLDRREGEDIGELHFTLGQAF